MYCSNCGMQNHDDASFCVKCGNNLSSIKPEIKRTGITGKLGKMGVPGFRSGKWWKMILATFVYLNIFLMFTAIIAAFVFGMGSPTPSASSTQIGNSPLITKSASEIGLKIDDLSAGWMGKGNGNETYYSSSFDKERFGIAHSIDSTATKYSTIDEAKQAFYKLKNDNSDIKQISAGLGDESFAWEYGKESTVVFRKANIIVETWYGKQAGTGNIGDAKEYAKIVEKKI